MTATENGGASCARALALAITLLWNLSSCVALFANILFNTWHENGE